MILNNTPPDTRPVAPLREIWPEVVDVLPNLLADAGEAALAATVAELVVFDRCRCGAYYCATAYTRPRPTAGFGPSHRNVAFYPPSMLSLDTGQSAEQDGLATSPYLISLDVVDEEIACIEVLYDDDCRQRLIAALPEVRIDS
jgi:hypothetical protein